MEIIKITPRGYCHGVVTAMNKVVSALSEPDIEKPIYIIGHIVHNEHVTKALKEKGAITLEGATREQILEKVDKGTVIITAHGIAPNLIVQAKEKGLNVIDATCSDVYKTHEIIFDKIQKGYEILYVGKRGHPEPEGVLGIDKEHIHLVESKQDIDEVYQKYPDKKFFMTNQTTMSAWDTEEYMDYACTLFSQIEIENEICQATLDRQKAVAEMASSADLVIVVGDPKSNNSNRLVEISEKFAKTKAIRIESLNDLDIDELLKVDKVAITSGASTPTSVTRQVMQFVENFDKNDQQTWVKTDVDYNKILPRTRFK